MKSTRNLICTILFAAFAFGMNAQQVPGITIYDNASLGPNLLTDGSVEDPASLGGFFGYREVTGWGGFGAGWSSVYVEETNQAGSPCAPNQVVPHDGNQMLKMFGPFFGGFGQSGFFSRPNIPIKAGTAYQASCYMLSPTAGSCPIDNLASPNNIGRLHIEFKDASGALIEFASSDLFTNANANGTWQEFNIAGIAPSNAAFATIIVLFQQNVPNEGGAIYFDSFSLNEVRFPTAPTLGEWGILNLGLILLIIGIVAIRQVSINQARAKTA